MLRFHHLLNHLVFVQKVFMKEVNEVVQKMSGGDRLVPVWTDFGEELELHHSSPSTWSPLPATRAAQRHLFWLPLTASVDKFNGISARTRPALTW